MQGGNGVTQPQRVQSSEPGPLQRLAESELDSSVEALASTIRPRGTQPRASLEDLAEKLPTITKTISSRGSIAWGEDFLWSASMPLLCAHGFHGCANDTSGPACEGHHTCMALAMMASSMCMIAAVPGPPLGLLTAAAANIPVARCSSSTHPDSAIHQPPSASCSRLCPDTCAVEAEDDRALLRLLDKRCAELAGQRARDVTEIAELSARVVELQQDLDACLETIEQERADRSSLKVGLSPAVHRSIGCIWQLPHGLCWSAAQTCTESTLNICCCGLLIVQVKYSSALGPEPSSLLCAC